jgi:hypothetical protein
MASPYFIIFLSAEQNTWEYLYTTKKIAFVFVDKHLHEKKFIFSFGCKTDNDLGIALKFNYAAKGLVSQNVMLF